MTDIKNVLLFLVKRAGRHFSFLKRAGRHQKGAGRRSLQKRPRQNTGECYNGIDYGGKKDTDLYGTEWASQPRR